MTSLCNVAAVSLPSSQEEDAFMNEIVLAVSWRIASRPSSIKETLFGNNSKGLVTPDHTRIWFIYAVEEFVLPLRRLVKFGLVRAFPVGSVRDPAWEGTSVPRTPVDGC